MGQRGVRVQAIIAEFGGIEKIDIIQWHENAKDYIAQALSPAKNVRVELDKPSSAKASHVAEALRDKSEGQGEKAAKVFVPAEGFDNNDIVQEGLFVEFIN